MKASTPIDFEQDCQAGLLILGNNIERNVLSIEDVGDYIPGGVMVQDLKIMTNTYMNHYGCDYLRQNKESLLAMGPLFFEKFFPPEEMRIIKPEMRKFVMENDADEVHSFFQRIRPDDSTSYEWFHTTSRLYPGSGVDGSLKIFHVAVKADMLSYIGKKLNDLVDIDLYVTKNYHLFATLSVREKQVIRMIAEGDTSTRIAEQLFLSIHTVNNHRKNILHKLEVTSISQLIRFATAFGIF
ncbi:MAG TPA: helix-turn-helix transcriptional regulator [Pedobacter sp.]|nr:helix-turn-helix transcriptional regulator [Pedobacter sp.]